MRRRLVDHNGIRRSMLTSHPRASSTLTFFLGGVHQFRGLGIEQSLVLALCNRALNECHKRVGLNYIFKTLMQGGHIAWRYVCRSATIRYSPDVTYAVN